jgi:hypothetical protein
VEPISNKTPEEIALAVLRWLQSKEKWLLVFDNLDNISVVEGYLPRMDRGGNVLITTRNDNTDGIPAEGVEIIPMNSVDSVYFLLTRAAISNRPQEVVDEARRIVEELGCLPLAVEQAATYIRLSQNIFEYLNAYRQNRKALLSERLEGNYPYKDSVATTWKMSFQQLKTTNPNSTKILEVLAFLNPDEILVDFLKAGSSLLPNELKLILNDVLILRQSLRGLQRYSLIRVWDKGRKITIHRLVQSVIRDDLDNESRSLLSAQTIQIALSAFPHTVEGRNRATCRTYRSQVTAILANNEGQQSGVDNGGSNRLGWQLLAERLALYLFDDGYYSDSLKYFAECLEIRKRVL